MSTPIPPSRPKASRDSIVRLLTDRRILDKVCLVGVRGYYSETFAPAGNNRGVYDDAMFIVTPSLFAAYNANTDPSVSRHGIAVLERGLWRYKPGIHGLSWKAPKVPYPAFVQAAKVTVKRDGKGLDTGFFGINIHRGGIGTTSSEGCQTIPPSQWGSFRSVLNAELKRFGLDSFPYLLIDGSEIQ